MIAIGDIRLAIGCTNLLRQKIVLNNVRTYNDAEVEGMRNLLMLFLE